MMEDEKVTSSFHDSVVSEINVLKEIISHAGKFSTNVDLAIAKINAINLMTRQYNDASPISIKLDLYDYAKQQVKNNENVYKKQLMDYMEKPYAINPLRLKLYTINIEKQELSELDDEQIVEMNNNLVNDKNSIRMYKSARSELSVMLNEYINEINDFENDYITQRESMKKKIDSNILTLVEYHKKYADNKLKNKGDVEPLVYNGRPINPQDSQKIFLAKSIDTMFR